MPELRPVLIAAMSGRALAQSARRGGYVPLVADFFGDQDTLQVAGAHVQFGGRLAHGIAERHLMQALEELSRDRAPVGLVCGSGFEDRSGLLRQVAERWRLFGNDASVVSTLKDPERLAALCKEVAIPFPDFSLKRPLAPGDWLTKRIGGAGGAHIRPASHPAAGAVYYQRKMPGVAVSALFLAAGGHAELIGFSAQWCSPTADKPYRYGGAVRPAPLAATMQAALAACLDRLATAASLVGLNSADFLVDGDHYWLLEVNPRPGATLDIFEPPRGSLFARHISACVGSLAAVPSSDDDAKAAAIVYAEEDISSFPALDWPDWIADRPCPGSTIPAGEPLCTVYACGSTACAAKALADERRQMVLAWTRERQQWQRRAPSA
jgi:predicted ATP-grasp superfamily ATP-dependent carboligase